MTKFTVGIEWAQNALFNRRQLSMRNLEKFLRVKLQTMYFTSLHEQKHIEHSSSRVRIRHCYVQLDGTYTNVRKW